MKEHRPRLDEKENELILHLREHGTIPASYRAESDRNAESLRKDNTALKSKEKEHIQHIHQLEEKLEGLTDFTKGKKDSIITIAKRKKGKSQSWAFALMSDVHIEERVNPDKIHGKNEYTLDIAEARIKAYFKNLLYLIETQRGSTEIKGLVFALLGDMISGYIHQELEETNQCSPIKAAWFFTNLIENGIRFLIDEGGFDEIRIPCVVGNHGRTVHKPRSKTAVENNFESFVYLSLADTFRDHSVVKVDVAQGKQIIVDVWSGFKIRMHHGDSIRGGQGIGGVDVPIKRYLAKLGSGDGVKLDCIGHFHQLVFGQNYIINGSVIGYNEYALAGGFTFERPQQAFFLIERDHGLTVRAPILLE